MLCVSLHRPSPMSYPHNHNRLMHFVSFTNEIGMPLPKMVLVSRKLYKTYLKLYKFLFSKIVEPNPLPVLFAVSVLIRETPYSIHPQTRRQKRAHSHMHIQGEGEPTKPPLCYIILNMIQHKP